MLGRTRRRRRDRKGGGAMNEMREQLIQLLSRYFDIGDSYTYNLTRVKSAFAVGTVDLDDFEEYTEDDVADLADHLLDNGVIVPPVSIGQTVWAIEFYRGKPIAIHEDMVQMVGFTSRSVKIALRNHHSFGKTFVLGKTVFLTREAALKAREGESE